MIGEPYPFLSNDYIPATDVLLYIFTSVSETQVIPKAIAYTPIVKSGSRFYNLGFGDLVVDPATGEYKVDDKVESNNGDVATVFYTVVSTMSSFFERYPDGAIHIEGSTPQRMNIYRWLIVRHWKQIEPIYRIEGFTEGRTELFQPDVDYDYVLIYRQEPLI